MPLKRTPPTSSLTSPLHHVSEPGLSKDIYVESEVATPKITVRQKRRRSPSDEISEKLSSFMSEFKELLEVLKREQNHKFETLSAAIDDIKKQNCEIQSSVEFLSQSYDSIIKQIDKLEKEKQQNLLQIKLLETRMENYERLSRSTCIEIKNIPTIPSETKDKLLNMVISVGSSLNVPINSHEIKDVFRVNSRDATNRPVLVDFTGVMLKERVIKMYRKSNRENNRLTTDRLKLPGLSKPVFISESLTPKMKRLFFLARDFAKLNNYSHCWVSNGKILLRKKEGERSIIVRNETDLSDIETKK